MKTKDNIIKLKECEHDGQICIECGTSFFKAITQARADERKKVGKELLGYFLGEKLDKKVELAIKELTGVKL